MTKVQLLNRFSEKGLLKHLDLLTFFLRLYFVQCRFQHWRYLDDDSVNF